MRAGSRLFQGQSLTWHIEPEVFAAQPELRILQEAGIVAIHATPMIERDEVAGVISLFYCYERRFTKTDIDRHSIFAGAVAREIYARTSLCSDLSLAALGSFSSGSRERLSC